MKDTSILCFIKNYSDNDTLYMKFIRKVPRKGEYIVISNLCKGKVVKIEYVLYSEDDSQTVYIYIEKEDLK